MTQKNIILLPQSEKHVLCYQYQGWITLEDHHPTFKAISETVARYGKVHLLFYYTDAFKGWEPDAADDNMKVILQYGQNAKRLAYVNPPEKKIIQHKMAPELFGGEIRYYKTEDLEQAINWVKEM